MHTVTIIFPHQLFKNHPAIQQGQSVYLVEEWLFFKQYNFHKQKLLLHRASMQRYADELKKQKITLTYIDSTNPVSDIRKLVAELAGLKFTCITIADVADNWLRKRLIESCRQYGLQLNEVSTPNFLNKMADVSNWFDKKKTYFQTAFYIEQRKQRNILLDASGNGIGGKWSYDADNQKKFPKTSKPPKVEFTREDSYVKEARQYVNKYFPNNYGDDANLIYPTSYTGAEKWLTDFLETRFENFGDYEDAIVHQEHFLHHAVLTPMLNIGLISPQQIVDLTIKTAAEKNTPLNSVEGFIRQIIGWREFIRIVYEREGSKQRTTNYWRFNRNIPKSFWTGNTGIFPVDNVIKKTLLTGYSHHIERLMVLGNFMLLCEFDPNQVHRWFMEMYVDAYDWVMVPNVYGMTQFADGGLMTTKPYISGSNYLLKMSDYPKGEWTEIWDALFWRFMHVHRDFFLKNPRIGMLVKTFDKMPAAKRQKYIDTAEKYLSSLDEA